MSVPMPAPPPRAERFHAGRFVAGVIIALLGVGWLLEALDVTQIPWRVLLPATLVFVGVALIAGSRSSRSHGPLVAVGIVLTAFLTLGTAVDLPLAGGAGARTERPASLADVQGEYRLGLGELTIDLTRLPPPTEGAKPVRIKVRVGMGRLVVLLPDHVLASVRGHAGIGDVEVFGRRRSGFDVQYGFEPDVANGTPIPFALDLSVGVGSVEVRYG
jgi:predicted membrane protein